MSKEMYLNVTGNPTTLLIFDQFVKQLGITKTAAITNMLEVYMLATNQDLYLKLKRDFLNVDAAKKLMEKRTGNIKIASPDDTFSALWMRWKNYQSNSGQEYTPDEIFALYVAVIKKFKYALFGLNGPAAGTGFASDKENRLRTLLDENGTVPLLISHGEKLAYIAEFDAFFCNPEKIKLLGSNSDAIPDNFRLSGSGPHPIPDDFANESYRIWLRLRSLRKVTDNDLTADKIFFQPKKNEEPRSLETILTTTCQLPFGYICI